MKCYKNITYILAVFIFINGQMLFAQTPANYDKKVDEILKKTRQTVGISDKDKINSVSIVLESFSTDQRKVGNESLTTKTNSELEIGMDNSGNLRFFSKASHENLFRGKTESNDSTIEYVYNGEQISLEQAAFVNGREMTLPLNYPTREKGIADLNWFIFQNTFPLLLSSDWYLPSDFSYQGVAESGKTRADIIQTTVNDRTFRFFIDQKTHLLLMASESWIGKNNKKQEVYYFYSDYKKMDGLLIPTKIKAEKNKVLIEERAVKNFEVNPKLKKDYFAIRKPIK